MQGDEELSIGEVAKRAGVRTSKIRYYESVGLLTERRRASGYRVYGADALDTLRLIQFAQDAGFSIEEIRHVLAGFDRQTPASARWQRVARGKLAEMRARIDAARKMERILERLVACECVRLDECAELCGTTAVASTPTLVSITPRSVRRAKPAR